MLPNQTKEEFIRALKRLIARRGCPETIYSDNAKTVVAASKWIMKINKSEILHQFLNTKVIKWKFNLSRAPWWGGQFQKMVGLVKNALYKTVGKSKLERHELAEVLTDIETTLNKRPLTYMEEDIEFPVLTLNLLVLGEQLIIPNEDPENIKDKDIRKCQKYIQKCKEVAWNRWRSEYLTLEVKLGKVVVIKDEEQNRAQWNIGIMTDVYPRKDGRMRAVKLRAGKSYLERAAQHLHPLKISCDITPSTEEPTMNVNAEESRPRRNVSEIGRIRIIDLANDGMEEPLKE